MAIQYRFNIERLGLTKDSILAYAITDNEL